MKTYALKLYLRGIAKPQFFVLASEERERWLESHNVDRHPNTGFGEFRTADHHHLFIHSDHVLVAQILDEHPEVNDDIPDDYDAQWKQRKDTDSESGEFSEERWRFRFWVHGCDTPFEVADLDEHDYVTISCGLLNYESDGRFFLTLTDEDGDHICIRAADLMLAEGFDYLNSTETA